MDDGAAVGGTGICRVRRSVRPDERGEGIREADGLPGEKTFGDFGSFQSHSPRPEGRAKPRRGQRPRMLWGKATSRELLRNALRRWSAPPPGDSIPPATGL
ncbi:hypothetical protein D3C79_570520 [compost metagenome]